MSPFLPASSGSDGLVRPSVSANGSTGGRRGRKMKPRRAALDAESLPSLEPAGSALLVPRPASAPPPRPPSRPDSASAPAEPVMASTRVSARMLAAALPPRPGRGAGVARLIVESAGAGAASGSGKLRTRPTNNQLL